jgi:NAD(P)-dependent dehydrogenase (short-subunit alcohol dehydrogenase family)
MDLGIQGRIAVVTGAGKGIGAAIARELATEGAVVMVTDVDRALATETADAIRAGGGEAHPFRLDVANRGEVADVFGIVRVTHGPIAILVNNAGILRRHPTATSSDGEWDAVESINYRGARYCCQEAMEEMRDRRWGRIVNIISLVVKIIGRTDVASYATSKAALAALTKILAKDLGESGVTVNAVLPGSIALTDFNDDIGYPKDTKPMPGMSIPIGRRGTPEDVAPTVAFLCSEKAAYITGEFIDVNGGLLMD